MKGIHSFAAVTPRRELQNFTDAMERQLRRNDHKGGWRGSGAIWLLSRLKEEVAELDEAIDSGDARRICGEATDVANFAMMIWDVVVDAWIVENVRRTFYADDDGVGQR